MTNLSNYNFSTTVSHVTGALLHCLREFKGIKQTDMAQNIEMSTSGLSKLEKGETNISIEQIFIFGQQFDLKSSEFMYLLELAIEEINQKGIFVANTKSKVVHIEKTNNVPVVMGVAALLGLATGSPLTALGMAAISGVIAQNNIDNKAQIATTTNELQLLTDIGTLKNIIQQSIIEKYEKILSKS
ncbi:XRE family transcriptional regulator [Acinetobacter sp. ANC 3781]|uniref:helix-turn-helix domain-containing protein n=1 Tax=Acinetobacter sp. ANC 3781 TaxID=2529835 RepID=UPI00103E9BBE|nr:helix-turn-helix transcriptional regulator [Acinetobacter sp. ANC 3781]TCB75548.1 XRE family transcriptional regulator [Acinetobacter sp. ANC 3781]